TGHDDAPRTGTAHRVLRDVRPEHEEWGVGDQEIESDPENEHPHPRVLDERAPAVAELGEKARPRPCERLHLDLREEQRAQAVRRSVEKERGPRTDGGDDRPT